MSMHRKPLTPTEEAGLRVHGMQRDIGTLSQLADVFRQGVAWGEAAIRTATVLECIDIVALHGGSVEIEAHIRSLLNP